MREAGARARNGIITQAITDTSSYESEKEKSGLPKEN
jgi:hypothetical protein